MRRRLPIGLAAVVSALAVPALGQAAPSIRAVDVPLAGERTPAAATAGQFTLVGLHWQGTGSVRFRTRALDGRWSSWRAARPEAEDAPDPGSREAARRAGWRLGNPWWTGPSDRIEYRLTGSVRRLRAWLVQSPEQLVPTRRVATATAPLVLPRAQWGADESIRRADPSYATSTRLAVVHHTAGKNTYTREEAPAIVRAIQLYHVKGNGWNDIGYNFLVDRYGTVYEGRYGGIDRNVVGAHAQGFNTGTVGVALLGTYEGSTAPTAAAEDALARLLAWRLDAAHVDPLSTLQYVSNGNPRFAAGLPVFMRAVSGHRDTGFTSCPGDVLYGRLAGLAARTQAIGLPKVWEPLVTGKPPGPVRFRARVSGAIPWNVAVTDALGAVVASSTGTGPAVDWTWDASLAAPGRYRWRIGAGAGALAATGTVGTSSAAVPLAISGVALDPETVSPNGDGREETTTLTYELSAPATVSVQALDASALPLLELLAPTRRPAGQSTVAIDPAALPDGTYELLLIARDDAGGEVQATTTLSVLRTLAAPSLAPAAFSPNGDRRADTLSVRFRLTGPAHVRLRVLRDGKWVATPFSGPLKAGQRVVRWDGSKRSGRLRDGTYVAVLEAGTEVGTARVELPFVSDTRAPVLRFLPGLPIRLSVSEPAGLTLRVNGAVRKLRLDQPGTRVVAKRGSVRAVAWDAAGNRSGAVRRP